MPPWSVNPVWSINPKIRRGEDYRRFVVVDSSFAAAPFSWIPHEIYGGERVAEILLLNAAASSSFVHPSPTFLLFSVNSVHSLLLRVNEHDGNGHASRHNLFPVTEPKDEEEMLKPNGQTKLYAAFN